MPANEYELPVGGGGSDTVLVEVAGGAGPFQVTSHNSNVTWIGGQLQAVTAILVLTVPRVV